jgi:lipoprotein-releasing system ATP-binding protein
MSDPVLVVRGLKRSYVAGERTLEVLKGVDLEVYPGELVGLVGPSGSGKSSLLHAAGLLEHPTAGTILVDGADCSQLGDAAAPASVCGRSASSINSITCCPSSRPSTTSPCR